MSAFAKLPPSGGTARDVALAVNAALDGKLASVGTATAASNTTLTISDPLVSADSMVLIMPTTAIARDATIAVSTETITVTFGSNPGTQTIKYIVLG